MPGQLRRVVIVAVLLAVALAVRVALVQATSYRPIGDARFYLELSGSVAATGDYPTSRAPGAGAGGTRGPSAYFAPGYPYFLAAVRRLAGDGVPAARIAQALLGTAIVAAIGLVALEACGEAAALAALGLAAVYPALVELSAVLVAENLFTLTLLGASWAALRSRRAATPRARGGWVATAGLLLGLATLTHENAIVAIVPLAALVGRRRSLILIIGCALAIAPWTVRNAVVLHRLIPDSDETGMTLAGTYNPTSAGARPIPYKWRPYWEVASDRALAGQAARLTEPQLSSRLTARALHYIAGHPAAPLVAAADNSLRLLDLEGGYAWHASAYGIGIPARRAAIAVAGFWLLLALAAAGTLTATARRAPRWLWAIPALMWLSAALVNGETPRFRAPVDPFLLVLAGCAVAYAVRQSAVRAGRRWRPVIDS